MNNDNGPQIDDKSMIDFNSKNILKVEKRQ